MPHHVVSFTLNGEPVTAEVEARRLLVHHLRDDHRLTGTHIGCDTSQCGACTVLMDGLATKSCSLFTVQVEGRAVTTIEGLSPDNGPLHPMQQAFADHHALQCGFCTPGMVLTALDLVADLGDNLSESDVRAGLRGNLCRCTGYQFIVEAILDGAKRTARSSP